MLIRVIHLHLLSLLHQVHLLRIIGHKTLREFAHKGRRRPIFCGHQMLSKNYLDLAQLLLDVRLIDLHLLHHGSLRHGQRHCRPRVQGDPLQRRPQDGGHLRGRLHSRRVDYEPWSSFVFLGLGMILWSGGGRTSGLGSSQGRGPRFCRKNISIKLSLSTKAKKDLRDIFCPHVEHADHPPSDSPADQTRVSSCTPRAPPRASSVCTPALGWGLRPPRSASPPPPPGAGDRTSRPRQEPRCSGHGSRSGPSPSRG